MPFDFQKYDEKCATLDGDALQREWEHYTRLISGAATSTAVSGIAVPFTLGVSSIGVALAAPSIHNARKKREIIERHMQRQGRTVHTRKRDVITAGAISGTIGVVTLGLAPVGADAVANTAAEHGIAYIVENELGTKIVTHLALDGAGVAIEEKHAGKKKEKAAWKAYTQAVKEGKNPPLPAADMKLPTDQATQPIELSSTSALPLTPAISIIPASGNVTAVEATAMYFPPPPGQAPSTSMVASKGQMESEEATAIYFPPPPGQDSLSIQTFQHRRHSISTLSMATQSAIAEQVQPKQNTHLIYGTTTAISAPMTAGQSYCIQISEKHADEIPRPSSAMSNKQAYTNSTGTITTQQTQVNDTSEQILPPPPYMPHESSAILSSQRARAHSIAQSSIPSYPTYQTPVVCNASHIIPPPPPLLTPPPSVPTSPPYHRHSISSPMTDYFQTMSVNSDSQHRPDLETPSIWTPPCTAGELPSSYKLEETSTDAVFLAPDAKLPVTDQLPLYDSQAQLAPKIGITSWTTPDPQCHYTNTPTIAPVYWTIPDPITPVGKEQMATASTVLWTTPDPHVTSYPAEKQGQKVPYFSPPPHAY